MRLLADWECFGLVPSLPYGLKDVHDDRGPYQYCTVCTAGVKNAETAASGFDFCIPASPTKFTEAATSVPSRPEGKIISYSSGLPKDTYANIGTSRFVRKLRHVYPKRIPNCVQGIYFDGTAMLS